MVLSTSGAVTAVFTHGVSRNGDPHVHSHLVLANLVHGADGRWGACDRRGIEAHRMAASAVYDAHLRAALVSALGVRWAGAPGRSAEVVGVRPELLGAFSTRGADIRRHMHEAGARSSRGARVAWAATRPAKSPSAPFADLAARWQLRAAAVGVPLELELGRARSQRAVLDEHHFAGVLSLTPHGGARRRDVVTAFGAAARDGVSAPAAARLVDQWVPQGPEGWRNRSSRDGWSCRRTITCASWVPARSTPTTTRSGGAPPAPSMPIGSGGVSGGPRRRSARRRAWPRCPPTRLADHVRIEREVAVARARLGWREPFTAERGLGR